MLAPINLKSKGKKMLPEMAKAMSEHAVFEMYSGYIYLQASLAMEKENYKGYSKWLFDHYKEEFTHAEDFIAFLQKRDVTPQLSDIKYEAVNLKTPLEVAKLILEHEKQVTARISALLKQARELGDYASEVFLHSYIDEQIEEEDIAKNNFDLFTLAGDNISAKLSVDLTFTK